MKYFGFVLIGFIILSCTNEDLIIETGELSNGIYINTSLGIVINYDEKLLSPFSTDSLNRPVAFERAEGKTINFNDISDRLLNRF